MCINLILDTLKIYNINSSNEYFIQQYVFVQSDNTMLLIQNIENTSLKSTTSCNGYERALVEYPSGFKLAKSR